MPVLDGTAALWLAGALVAGGVSGGVVVLGTLVVGAAAYLGLYPLLPRDLGGAPDLDREARGVRIPVNGDDVLDGWLLPPRERAMVLVLHAHGRDHARAWRYGAFLYAAGYGVLAVNFRSSRWSRRLPTTLGHHEIVDAQAALEWLRGQVLLGAVIGVLSYAGLLLLHVKYALVLALLAGIVGVLLAVPAAIIVKVLVDEWLEERAARETAVRETPVARAPGFE